MSSEEDFTQSSQPVLELRIDDDAVPLTGSLTIGRHLDNDLIIAGEDVLDYHARVALSARAVTVHPLLDATIIVNDVTYDQAMGIVPGDQVRIGSSDLQVAVSAEPTESEPGWFLHHTDGPDAIRLQTTQTIGRDEEADIQIVDDHISRIHARISLDHYVWVSDLASANGSFVNGERITGGVRLFHGDYLSFDTIRYQLIGSAPELTPVRIGDEAPLEPITSLDPPELRSDTTVVGIVDLAAEVQAPVIVSDMLLPAGAGAFFVGASEPVEAEIFRTKIGRCVMGRSPACDIVINDPTVSLEHAEVVARAEGCTLTNLMATNGTRINGDPIQSQQLSDGDIVRLGQVSLVYKDVPIKAEDQRLLRKLGLGLLIGCVVVAIALLFLLD
ncbi:MAG: FHA domain-containing protein [Pseudomonadales bacterium]